MPNLRPQQHRQNDPRGERRAEEAIGNKGRQRQPATSGQGTGAQMSNACQRHQADDAGRRDQHDRRNDHPSPHRLIPYQIVACVARTPSPASQLPRSKTSARLPVLMSCRWFLLASILLAITSASAQQQSTKKLFDHDVSIPMRDGVVLRADIMRPAAPGRIPVLVYRTPYGKEFAGKEYTTFSHAVDRGYAVVIEDVRGRYASAGEFRPYENEGRDGYDTIEWAARQPWSDGNVGTFGLSYPGAVQWLAAVETPPHLKAMVPAMTFSTPQNFFYAHGLWDLSWLDWIWDNIAPDVRVKKNLLGPRTYDEDIADWKQVGPKMQTTLPLTAVEELRSLAPYYYDWL